MSTATTPLVSLEQFQSNPDIHYYDFNELHDGEIVEVPAPTNEHVDIQSRLVSIFRSIVRDPYTVYQEFYYTLPRQSRRADVAVVLESRRQDRPKRVFFGAPEVLVEVLSYSNGSADLIHLRLDALADHCEQFWIVDPFQGAVEIYYRDGSWKDYREGDSIDITFAGQPLHIQVSSIFEASY